MVSMQDRWQWRMMELGEKRPPSTIFMKIFMEILELVSRVEAMRHGRYTSRQAK